MLSNFIQIVHYCLTFFNETLKDIQEGVKAGGEQISAISFADDQAMVSHTLRGLQVIMDALQNTSEKYNMRITTKKTKVLSLWWKEEL